MDFVDNHMKPLLFKVFLALLAFSTVGFSQPRVVDIECRIEINEHEWRKGTPIRAKLIVKNNSDQEVKLELPPIFHLAMKGAKRGTTDLIFGQEYYSGEKEKDHLITKRRKNGYSYRTRQFFSFPLKRGESTFVDFDLTNLRWNDFMSSYQIDTSWYEVVPSGTYDLIYEWGYDVRDGESKPYMLKIYSNLVEVKLNSDKK